jgi:hypothetical protein
MTSVLTIRRLKHVYIQMRQRCNNPNNHAYHNYGKRGIRVDGWKDLSAFIEWAVVNGYAAGLTLERKNNELGYNPDNCIWATRVEQNNNSRRNRRITAFGETKSMSLWAQDSRCNTTETGLRKRLNRGWTSERAITETEKVNQYA